MKPKTYKLGINDLGAIGLAFVVSAVTVGIGATVLANIRATQLTSAGQECGVAGSPGQNCTIAANATGNGLTSMSSLAAWFPTIAIVGASAVVLGLVMRMLGNRGD